MQFILQPSREILKTDALILTFAQFDNQPALPETAASDARIASAILLAAKLKDFRGKKDEVVAIPLEHDRIARVVLVGVGKISEWSIARWMETIGAAVRSFSGKSVRHVAIAVPAWVRKQSKTSAMATLVAVNRALYVFEQYKMKKDEDEEKRNVMETIAFVELDRGERRQWQSAIDEACVLLPALDRQRNWGNMPSADCTPTFLAIRAEELAKETPKLSVTVFDKEEIKKRGMGGIYGVSRGAGERPTFIILEYWGAAKSLKPFVFVGKGITFDSGGISIKPSEKMDEMKFDMLGAAAVINAVAVIAKLNLKVNVVGLAPCTENIPGHEAYKPGDILKTVTGSTIEVLNTDAEGRVILSDALGWAHRYDPLTVVDLATLTGAAVVVLGHVGSVAITNNQRALAMVQDAANRAQDRIWQLPLWDEFKEAVKSDIADVKNASSGFGGSVITAGAFLEHFVRPLPWVHLDIASTAWVTTAKPWIGKGATDVGVRLLVEVAKQWKEVQKSGK